MRLQQIAKVALTVSMIVAFGCTEGSSPTSMSQMPSSSLPSNSSARGYGSGTSGTPSASTQGGASPAYGSATPTSNYGTAPRNQATSLTEEEFNCTNVQETYVRFSDPGYVTDNAVGLFVSYQGIPAGQSFCGYGGITRASPASIRTFSSEKVTSSETTTSASTIQESSSTPTPTSPGRPPSGSASS